MASPDGEFITIFGDGCYLGLTGFKIIHANTGKIIHSEQDLHVINISWFPDDSGLIIEEPNQFRYFALDGVESVSVDKSDSNVVIVLK